MLVCSQATDVETDFEIPPVLGYPELMALLGLYVLSQGKIDLAVVETGMGGERDSTNIIQTPVATGITTLGVDHVKVLGNDICSIAWHKAGIFKPGSPDYTVEQDSSALLILKERSLERSTRNGLCIVTDVVAREYGVRVQPDMPYQRQNASLAIVLADTCLKTINPSFSMTSKLA